MKKLMSFIIVMMLLITSLPASAEIEFLFEPMTNYTENCKVKMTFDSSREFVSLLEEMQLAEQFEVFADIEKFMETLMSVDCTMFVEADISTDLKKAQVSVTTDSFNSVDLNQNLQVNITSRAGLWMVYDFSNINNPVYEIVYSLPFMNKYVHIDLMEMMPEEDKQQFAENLEASLSTEKVDEMKKFMVSLYEKHADIKVSFSKATIKIDNESLIGLIEDLIPYVVSMIEASVPKEESETIAAAAAEISLDGLKLLGDKGMVFTYDFKNGKISSYSSACDISIDISKIFTAVTGETWNFVSSGKLDFTLTVDSSVSKLGMTKVKTPVLTEKNSISLSDMMNNGVNTQYPEELPAEPTYPMWYVGGGASKLPIINGEIYVPLRTALESGYGDTVQIEFNDGVISARCDYFPGFKSMILTNGSDRIYLDGQDKIISAVIIDDGTTYVSNKLFTDVFGWQFEEAYHYMIDDTYWFSFFTEQTMFENAE